MTLIRVNPTAAHSNQEFYQVQEHKRLEGNPKMAVAPWYQSTDQKFAAGVWESEPGKWKIQYTEDEYCCLIQGVSIITDERTGEHFTVKANDHFIIPAGFTGTWEVVEYTKKIYALYEKN